jgi:hypothetical protein
VKGFDYDSGKRFYNACSAVTKVRMNTLGRLHFQHAAPLAIVAAMSSAHGEKLLAKALEAPKEEEPLEDDYNSSDDPSQTPPEEKQKPKRLKQNPAQHDAIITATPTASFAKAHRAYNCASTSTYNGDNQDELLKTLNAIKEKPPPKPRNRKGKVLDE